MAQLTVSKINGEVFAISRDGVQRILKLGDVVKDGETIITRNGATVSLVDDTNVPINVSENQTFIASPEIFVTIVPTAQDSAIAFGTSDIVIDSLNRGKDLSTTLEATAAGLTPGVGTDGGSSFVQLLRIIEGVSPLSYDYNYTTPDLKIVGEQLTLEEVTPVEYPDEPKVVITTESETRVSTYVTTDTRVGTEVETNRTSTTTITEELNDDETATIKTTTTVTTVTYNQATDTITTTVTTTETWVRQVTTTTYTNGEVTIIKGDWTLGNTISDTDTDTVTINTPRTEVLPDVVVIETPINPIIVITTETKTEEVITVKTETNVKGEVETGRTSTTTVTEELNDDKTATIKTTTVITTITYNQDTDTITITTVTTNTYTRDVTTTTYGTNDPVVITSEWVLTDTSSVDNQEISTVSTPRTEVITDVSTSTTPVEPPVEDDKGNNGVGNGEDPPPPGNPPINDGPGTGPGNPGNQGGTPGSGNNPAPPADPATPNPREHEDKGNEIDPAPGGSGNTPGTVDTSIPPIIDNDNNGIIRLPGRNPGNDKEVGNSAWDGETGASGNPGKGKTQDGIDTDINQPGGNEKGQNLNIADILQDTDSEIPINNHEVELSIFEIHKPVIYTSNSHDI